MVSSDTDKVKHTRRPYRILFFSHSAHLMGAERSLLGLLTHFDRDIIDPFVIIPEEGPMERELRKLGVPFKRVPNKWWLGHRNQLPFFAYRMARTAVAVPRLLLTAHKIRPALLYTNSLTIPAGAVVAGLLSKPHIWHVREIVEGNELLNSFLPMSMLLGMVLKYSARVVAVSESVRSQFAPQTREKVKVIYNGVELYAQYLNKPKRDRESGAKLAMVGSLSKTKGQLDAIKAIELVREELPDVHLSIVGDGPTDYRNALESYIKAGSLTSNVSLLGYVEDPMPILRASDLSIVAARTESFSRVLVESLAVGTPVVATDSGGPREILQHGGGALVSPGQPELLAQRILSLLQSPENMKILQSEALEVASRFSVQRTAALVQSEIISVIEGDK